MNPLDIFIIMVFAFCLIRGIFRGLVKEVSSIIGVLGGFYAAYTYYPFVAQFISPWLSNHVYLNIISFSILFFGVLIIISIIGVILKYLMNIASLGWIDRILGAGFGSVKGLLIISVLFFALTAFLPKGAPVIKNSVLSPKVALVSENLAKVASKDMKQQFIQKLNEFKSKWKTK